MLEVIRSNLKRFSIGLSLPARRGLIGRMWLKNASRIRKILASWQDGNRGKDKEGCGPKEQGFRSAVRIAKRSKRFPSSGTDEFNLLVADIYPSFPLSLSLSLSRERNTRPWSAYRFDESLGSSVRSNRDHLVRQIYVTERILLSERGEGYKRSDRICNWYKEKTKFPFASACNYLVKYLVIIN